MTFLNSNYNVDLDCPLIKCGKALINIKRTKSKEYYNVLISKIVETPTSVYFWQTAGVPNECKVMESFKLCRKVTKEARLQVLQFKLIHNIVATNKPKKSLEHSPVSGV